MIADAAEIKRHALLAVLRKIHTQVAWSESRLALSLENSLALDVNYVFNQIFPSVRDRKDRKGVNYRFLGLDFGVILEVETAWLLKSCLLAFLIPLLTDCITLRKRQFFWVSDFSTF